MFYDRFKELCIVNNTTPTAVALELGISRATVSYWKSRGSEPSATTIQKIADYFNVTTDYLLNGDRYGDEDDDKEEDQFVIMSRMSRDFDNLTEDNKKKHIHDIMQAYFGEESD